MLVELMHVTNRSQHGARASTIEGAGERAVGRRLRPTRARRAKQTTLLQRDLRSVRRRRVSCGFPDRRGPRPVRCARLTPAVVVRELCARRLHDPVEEPGQERRRRPADPVDQRDASASPRPAGRSTRAPPIVASSTGGQPPVPTHAAGPRAHPDPHPDTGATPSAGETVVAGPVSGDRPRQPARQQRNARRCALAR